MMGFTAYVYILKKSTATRVATYALVNPVVALLLGWLFAGETITLRTELAAAVILAAVLLVITAPKGEKLWRRQLCGRLPKLDPRNILAALTFGDRRRHRQIHIDASLRIDLFFDAALFWRL